MSLGTVCTAAPLDSAVGVALVLRQTGVRNLWPPSSPGTQSTGLEGVEDRYPLAPERWLRSSRGSPFRPWRASEVLPDRYGASSSQWL